MKLRWKTILSSLAISVGSFAVLVGGTYALFTNNNSTNIAITSGKVELTATASIVSLYSPQSISGTSIVSSSNIASNSKFGNEGTASISNGALILSSITPGDSVITKIDIANTSDISIKYRVYITDNTTYANNTKPATNLYDSLTKTFSKDYIESTGSGAWSSIGTNGSIIPWTSVSVSNKEIADVYIKFEFPVTADNSLKGLGSSIQICVEAVQNNSYTVDLS